MNTEVMFSSKTDAWATPADFYQKLNSEIGNWVEKAFRTNEEHGNLVVMLLPARTDTKWFHEYIYHKAEIRFVRGRLKFGNSKNAAPFPSMVVIYNQKGI